MALFVHMRQDSLLHSIQTVAETWGTTWVILWRRFLCALQLSEVKKGFHILATDAARAEEVGDVPPPHPPSGTRWFARDPGKYRRVNRVLSHRGKRLLSYAAFCDRVPKKFLPTGQIPKLKSISDVRCRASE